MGFFAHVKKPYLTILASGVVLGVGGGALLIVRNLRTDPTFALYNKRTNPYPWLSVPQDQNLKLYSVNQKFETGVRETYIK
ncbi:hypothetical protein BC831DRAFT_509293 [Entophlyctis helioformis]|nr:hypothetical protein BC831DRAFT_513911 [Entophlyctis helioformis]KAI8929384.1 hypothetical protein BC831DRAFT_509293 [Entophlyctis helioformis]